MPRGDSVLVSEDSASNHTVPRRAAAFGLTLDELVWFVGSICQQNTVAFDASLVRRRAVPPCTSALLSEVLAELGFETRVEDRPSAIHIAVTALASDSDERVVP